MKHICLIILPLIFTLSGTLPADATEIVWRGSGGWGAGLPYQQSFLPSRVEKISGTILSIERFGEELDMADGILLKLQHRRIIETVHIGPFWFLERQDLSLNVGDSVSVRGARVDGRNAAPYLIASSIKKGANTLLLRNRDGFPLWTGWRRD